jgi:cytochrome c-type biogenesis protein CcmE
MTRTHKRLIIIIFLSISLTLIGLVINLFIQSQSSFLAKSSSLANNSSEFKSSLSSSIVDKVADSPDFDTKDMEFEKTLDTELDTLLVQTQI